MNGPTVEEDATIEIDVPAEQVPQWLIDTLMSGAGVAWPYVYLRVKRARLAEPVTLVQGQGPMRFKATLHARDVEIVEATS